MALGPERILAEIQKRKAAEEAKVAAEVAEVAEKRRRALMFVEVIADCAEKLLDEKISTSIVECVRVYASQIKPDFGYDYVTDLIFAYAEGELEKTMRKRYSSKGWKRISVGITRSRSGKVNGYIELCC